MTRSSTSTDKVELFSLTTPSAVQRATLIAVVACFTLSGFAALLYQTAWLRQFSIAFGTSELAVATVLAAYMCGLAVGAAIADRWVGKVERPIFVYGLLEAGIAVSALAVPLLLQFAQWLYVELLGGQSEIPASLGVDKSLFFLVVAFVVLMLPTGFMGATLPLLTRYAVHSNDQVGPRVALLYAVNTGGAVLGVICAAFLLLPAIGLLGTVWVGVGINLLVFLIAVWLAKAANPEARITVNSEEGTAITVPDKVELGFYFSCVRPLFVRTAFSDKAGELKRLSAAWILPVMCVSGVASFSYEVLWTRMLGHVLGGSIFAFATMLASFLTGIALGSAIASKFCQNRQQAALGFMVTQVAIAGASIFVYVSLDRLIPDEFDFFSRALFAASVMLPATLFIGATFPFAVRILTPHEALIGNGTARVYAWNTLGAIAGAIAAGFWVIPALGFSGTIYVVVLANLVLAFVVAIILVDQRFFTIPVTGGLCLAAFFLFDPQRPEDLVNASFVDPASHQHDDEYEKELFYAVGRSATVMLKERDGMFYLRTNGLPEASIDPKGKPPGMHPQHWLTALPALARPAAQSMLVVGFGGGVALEGVPPSIKNVDVVELEPEVIAANRIISGSRKRDPLGDPRVRIIVNDARGALALTDKKFDIVVSQPSHPWTAGASHLYTREFVEIVRDHLNQDGVFLQWINWQFVDKELLRSLAATLQDAFVNVRLYQHSPAVLHFVASDGPLNIESSLVEEGNLLSRDADHFAEIGALSIEDVAYALVMDEAGVKAFASDAPITTDNYNRLAMGARLIHEHTAEEELFKLLQDHLAYLQSESEARQLIGKGIKWTRLIERMLTTGMIAYAELIAPTIEDPVERLVAKALIHRYRGESDEMYSALEQALDLNPDNQDARFMLIRSRLGSLARGRPSPKLQALANSATGIERAIIDGWRFGGFNDWVSLARLDPVLATARPNELWYEAASQLRAQWRTKVGSPKHASIANQQALEIIDRALATQFSFDLILIRLMAATRANDEFAMVESANMIAQRVEERILRAQKGDYLFERLKLVTTKSQLESITAFLSQHPFSVDQKQAVARVTGELETQIVKLTMINVRRK